MTAPTAPGAVHTTAHIDDVLDQLPALADRLGSLLPTQYTAMRSVVLAIVQLAAQLATALSLTVPPAVQAAIVAESGVIALVLIAIPALLHKWHVAAAASVQGHALMADAQAHAATLAAASAGLAKTPAPAPAAPEPPQPPPL